MILKTSYKMKPPVSARIRRGHQLARGLVGFWPLYEGCGVKVFDLSGRDNTGAITGALWSPGKFGSCLDFSTGSYDVNCGNDDVLNLFATGRSGTISFWARIPSVPGADTQRLIAKSDHGNARSLEIFYHGGLDGLYLQVYDGAVRKFVKVATTGLDDDVWRHYCFSVSPAFTKVYVNGVEDGTDEVAGNTGVTGTSNFYFARDDGVLATSFYDGYLDYVMAWNRALSALEIALLYKKSFCMFGRKALLVPVAVPEVPCCSSCVAHGWLEVA